MYKTGKYQLKNFGNTDQNLGKVERKVGQVVILK